MLFYRLKNKSNIQSEENRKKENDNVSIVKKKAEVHKNYQQKSQVIKMHLRRQEPKDTQGSVNNFE